MVIIIFVNCWHLPWNVMLCYSRCWYVLTTPVCPVQEGPLRLNDGAVWSIILKHTNIQQCVSR